MHILLFLILVSCSHSHLNLEEATPLEAYDEGVRAFKDNEYTLALAYFERANGDSKIRVKVIEARLASYKALHHYERFISEAKAYLNSDGAFNVDIRVQLADVYNLIGNDEEAVEVFEKILSLNPGHVLALTKLSEYYTANKKDEFAFKKINFILESDPKNIKGHLLKAAIYQDRGEVAKAVEELNLILSIDKKNSQAYDALIGLYAGSKDWDKAYEVANHMHLTKRDKGEVSLIRATCLVNLKRFDEAIVILDEVLEANASLQNVLYVANLFHQAKELQRAKELYLQALAIEPQNDEANFQILKININLNDLATAGNILRDLYEKNPDKEWIALSYAKVLEHVGSNSNAQVVLQNFTKKHESIDGLLALLINYEKLGQAQDFSRLWTSIKYKYGDHPKVNSRKIGTAERLVASSALGEASKDSWVYWTVRPGDSLGEISQEQYGTSRKWKVIYQANQDILSTPNSLKVGSKIKIPKFL